MSISGEEVGEIKKNPYLLKASRVHVIKTRKSFEWPLETELIALLFAH